MGKIGQVIVVTAMVAVVYLIMLVVMPFISDMAATANATMSDSSNLTNYPGAAEGLLAAPWFLWFAPGTVGMIAIVIILKVR